MEKWQQYRTGTEEVQINGEYEQVDVFEFPDESLVEEFLGEIGGMPHPLGGFRVVLSVEN